MMDATASHPHSGPTGHLSPSKGERNSSWKGAAIAAARFLSPRQGERCHAKRDGVGVLAPTPVHIAGANS
jgi:hypothetical protein